MIDIFDIKLTIIQIHTNFSPDIVNRARRNIPMMLKGK